MRWSTLFCGALIMTGCATSPWNPPRFESAEAALAAADQDVRAGRWSVALTKLQAAEQQFNDAPDITAKRTELARRWATLRAELQDRLVLVRARSRMEELALLERLERAEPGNVLDQLQLTRMRDKLHSQRPRLLDCGRRQLHEDVELAQGCVDLALAVQVDEESLGLHEHMEQQQQAAVAALQAKEAADRAKVAAKQAQERQFEMARRDRALDKAQALMDGQQYVRALTITERVLDIEPTNGRAQALRNRLKAILTRQSKVLNELADRLYGENNVDAAIRLWEASLRLVPDQAEAAERYKRAKKVRGNLKELREAPDRTR